MKGLTDITGIKVGHATDLDALTGCTVVLCEKGAVAGCDISGYATGSQELDVLSPYHVTDRIHAICLAGGSAFGLEAASGVRRWLEQKGIGFPTAAGVIPLVPSAILYDLGVARRGKRPSREMGEVAAGAATEAQVQEGCVGAGTGATCGKLLGLDHAMKSGAGSFTVEAAGVLVAALVVANPLGDILDPETGKIIAGARKDPKSREFAGSARLMREGRTGSQIKPQNTTLAVVATDARLTKLEATHLARVAQHGLVRAVSPVNTMSDGDITFALSMGNKAAPIDALGVAAAEAVAQAIARAARLARTMGGVPGLG